MRDSRAVAETRHGIMQYLPDEPLVGESLAWYGEYLRLQLDLLGRMLEPGATVLEVAPGVGSHALGLAARVGEQGSVILCEPRPVMERILRQNISANRCINVSLLDQSASVVGTARPRTRQADMQGSPPSPKGLEGKAIDELRLSRLDCLKIGIDADAFNWLHGSSDTLWRLRPLVFSALPDGSQTAGAS